MRQFTPRILQGVTDLGASLVKVEMTNQPGVFATVDEEDFRRLVAEGYPKRWFINMSSTGYWYVRFSSDRYLGKLESVGRVIMNAPKGRVVKYRDGDRTNLRRSNLYLTRGYAPGQTPITEADFEA